ncbi:MAG: transposase [Pirellulaceae bacterium]|nr:transposase [Pirellulaceae bacterium]
MGFEVEGRLRPTTMWNLAAPPGFVGFDSDRPVRIYSRHLPHWRQEGVTYFATFRLADSLPQNRLRELAALRATWEKNHPTPRSDKQWEALTRLSMEHVENWLDEGQGSCVLRQAFAADCLEQKLRHFDGQQYDLWAFVIMPNHVHLLVKPYSDALHPLERLEQAWKTYSARAINAASGTSGSLWQAESFDRMVRDEEHLYRCLQYIGRNPRRAGLGLHEARRWVRPEWASAGWGFVDS